MKETGISVVIPSYNAAGWLPTTIKKIETALVNSGIPLSKTEIIVVDDGSADNTKQVVVAIAKSTKVKVALVNQRNQGRYLARKNGVQKARFSYVWFVDSRVHVSPASLKYVIAEMKKGGDNAVWNAHVNVQKEGNIIARFMDAITYIGWRRYFKKPRRCSYGLEDFDHYPKGTTSFLTPKKLIVDAMKEFEKEDRDIRRSSDDTHLIRIIAKTHRINLSPKFSCTYHARTTLTKFVGQASHRGQTFIDGFLRPGTRFYVPLLIFLFASAVSVVTIAIAPGMWIYFAVLLAILWLCELLIALLLGVNYRDALSLFILSPVFFLAYGIGLWVAVVKRVWRKHTSPANRRSTIATLLALLFFTACTVFYYLGNSAANCSTTLASGPGDQTGLIWLNSTVNAPLWGSTSITNAPYGESLQSVTHVTGVLEYGIYWIIALFAGSVCGYNIFTSLGFVFSAMVVFLLVRSMTNRNDVAIFAGFAATFTPYLQIKTGVHPSYVFFGVFVLAIWLAIRMWYQPSVKKAIGLGLVISSFFFIDPYFTLLGGVVIVSTLGVLLGRILYLMNRARMKTTELRAIKARTRLFISRSLLAALVAFVCGLLPLLALKIQYGAQIEKEVSSVRSDIKLEAFTYSARPSEYLLPGLQNPFIGNIAPQLPLPDALTRKAHGSNPAEDAVSLSTAVLVLAVATCTVVLLSSFKNRFQTRLKFVKRSYVLPVAILAVVGFVALITSFPPKAQGLIWPSDIITNYITIWRVFARLAVIVAFCVATIAAIGLAMFTDRLRPVVREVIVTLVTLVVAFEFLTFVPFHDNRSWSYSQVHPFYTWLRDQPDVDTIAEYPLNEPGRTSVSVDYFRDQFIHKKHFINTFRAASAQAPLRNGLRDLTDPQTPAVLSTLGVDLVVVHAEDKKPIPHINGLELLDWNNSSNDRDSIYVAGKMWVYRVTAPKDEDGLFLVPGEGFSPLVRINSTYTEAGYVFSDKSLLSIVDLKTGTCVYPEGSYRVSLSVFSADKSPQLLISQSGKQIWKGNVPARNHQLEFVVDGGLPIELKRSGGKGSDGIIITDIDMKKL